MTDDKPPSILLTLVLSSFAASCGQRPLAPEDSEAGAEMTPDVEGGAVGDPWYCGEAQVSCVGPLGIGDCIDGECQGRLSGCWEAGASCAALCEGSGASCDASCDGVVAFGWMAASEDEALSMCVTGYEDTATPLSIACDQPLPLSDYPAIRCCCR